mmetsp:Transcript_22148/g.27814  ORF Transcript_22148/g.27814 Transcript_22148/m.27814 type:complete len:367 (+) Transcript_22148:131-1231(+)
MFSTFIQRAIEIGIGVYRTQLNASQVERALYSYGELAMRVAIRAFQALVIGFALLSSSCLIFALLYLVVMPRKLHDKEFFLDYGAPDYQPRANVDFLDEHTQWTPTNLTKVNRIGDRILKPGQKYTIIAELVLPESEANSQAGVFMVELALRTSTGQLLASSRRPALLRYRSSVATLISQLATWPLIALGLVREEQTLQIACFDSFEESLDYPMSKVNIQLSTTEIQISRAALGITAQLTGLAYLLQHHFMITASCCVLFIMCMEASFFGILFLWVKLVLMEEDSPENENETSIARSDSTSPSSIRPNRESGAPSGPTRQSETDLFTSGQRYTTESARFTPQTDRNVPQEESQTLRQRRPTERHSS